MSELSEQEKPAQPCGWCKGEGAIRDATGKLAEDCPRCKGRTKLEAK